MSEKIRNWELRIGNFVMFQDEIVKVTVIDTHRAVIVVEELHPQISDKEDRMFWCTSMEFIDQVPATNETLRECNLMFPIITNDFIISYNLKDHKLTINHFTIKNKHTFTAEFIHELQNFIIDFTKIKA